MGEGRTIMGYWDCSSCGTSGIKGDIRSCPNCSKPRDGSVKFYMKNKTEYVKEKSGSGKHLPDWVCAYCGNMNSYDKMECGSCGAPKSDSKTNYFTYKEPVKTSVQTKPQTGTPVPSTIRTVKHLGCAAFAALGILAVVVITVITLIIAALIPKSETVSVKGFEWDRSVEVEKGTPVDESGWYLPSGAELYDSREEFREYISVIDHYETRSRQVSHQEITGYQSVITGYTDNGDGTFTEQISEEPIYETVYETEYYDEPVYRQEPVYAIRYYYTIMKWSTDRYVNSSGKDHEPYWGELNLKEAEREGNHSAEYRVVTSKGKNDETVYIFEYDEWKQLEKGQEIEIKVYKDNTASLKDS